MRAFLLTAALAAAALASCGKAHSPSATLRLGPGAQGGPARGLWAQRVSDGRGVSDMQYCLGAPEARALVAFDQQLAAGCARRAMTAASGGAWRFRTACGRGASTIRTRGRIDGDFRTRYLVTATVRMATRAAQKVTVEIHRVGDCPSYLSPGDAILADGRRTTLAALAGGA